MKKLFIKIISILAIFLLNISIISAQQLTLPNSNACLNDTTLVPINFSNIDSLAALTLYVSYDTAVLTYVGFDNVNTLTSGIMCGVPTVGYDAWKVVISWVDNTLNGVNLVSEKLCDLKFKYKGGNSNLTFLTRSELSKSDGINVIIPTYLNGSIAPIILSQPISTQICEGLQTNFSVTTASGSTFQWQVLNGAQWDNLQNNTTYSGVNTNSLQINQTPYSLNNKNFRCLVTKNCTESSSNATLIVYPKPHIVINNDTTICVGNSVIISGSGSTGTGTLLYSWDQGLGLGITHTVAPTQSSTYHLTVTGANSCSSIDSIVVFVNQFPSLAGIISGTTTICKGQNGVIYTVPSINYATSYIWTLPTGVIGTSTTNSISINYTNTAISGNITVYGSNACGVGNSSSLAITVNPTPSVTNNATATTCSGTSPNIALTASTPSNFSWTIGTITGSITGATASSGASINQTLSNPSNATSGSVQYIVTPTSTTGSCVGNATTITVTVNPTPAVTNNVTATTCSGTSPNIALTASTPSNFVWTIGTITGSITGATANSGASINQILSNPNITNGSVQYIVTPTSTTGSCVGNPTTITVTVNPAPSVTNNTTATACSGTSPNISLTASVSSNFVWTIGIITGSITGATASSGTSINQTLTNPSNATSGSVQYIVTPTSTTGSCVGNPSTITVTVNPTPSVTNNATATTCSGTSPNIALTASTPSNFSWTIGTISGSITGATANSGASINQTLSNPSNATSGSVQYIVTPTSTTGSCVGNPTTITVTVNPIPAVTNNATATTCSGTSPNISLTASTPSNFSWTIGAITGSITGATANSGASINQILINPNITNGSVQYIVTPTSTTGSCVGNPTTITVTVNPAPSVTNNTTATTCSGTSPNISLTASVSSNFVWTIGIITGSITGATASSGTSINQTLTNPSNATSGSVQYIVTPTSTTGSCVGNPSTITVTVNPTPSVTNNATATTCSGTSPNISLTASVSSNFVWTIGTITGSITGATASSGGSINQTLSNPSNATSGSVQYIITPTSTTGSCVGNPTTITVTVNPIPAVTNNATATTCSGTSPNISLTASTPSNFAWTVGTITGSITGATTNSGTSINQILSNPNITNGSVQYIVTPTSTTGSCVGNPTTITVTVNPAPSVTNNTTATTCSGTSPNISLTASVSSNFAWTIGTITGSITGATASSGASINQTLNNPSNATSGTVQYIVTPTSTTGSCVGNPTTITITVNPIPAVTNNATATTCSGTSPNIALTASTPSNFVWTTGTITGSITGATASSGASINQTLSNPSNATSGSVQYIVTPTSTTGSCVGNPTTITVTVNPIPAVTNNATATTCSGTSPNISLTASTPSNFSWTIGAITGSITGATANSGASINQILINPNITNGSVQYIVTPTSTTGSCVGNPTTITVTVNPAPSVTNNTTATTCSGTSPNISLTASVSSNFVWTIGIITGSITGATASSGTSINQTLTNPSNATSGSVQYIVTPTSTTGSCVGNPTTITITVNPIPAVTNNATATTCSGTSPNISLTASVSSNFVWTIGTITGSITGATASSGASINQTLSNPSNATSGSVQYIVTPTSTTGSCVGNPSTITVTVNPIPAVTNNATATTCSGTSPNIALTASTPSNFSWTIGTITGSITGATANSGASINQILINPNITNGSVQYIVTPTSTTGSCVGNPTTITVTVNPAPSVTNNTTATTCSGTSPNISLTASTPSNFAWTIGTITGSITGATASSGASINQTLSNPSNATSGSVQYIITPTSTTGSCVGNPTTITVTVNPIPAVTNNATATTCSGTSPNIALTASVSSNFTWTIGTITGSITGATASSGASINQTLSNPSNATSGSVQYIVTPTSTTGSCVGDSFNIIVTVDPLPVAAGIISGLPSVCQGQTSVTYTIPIISSATSYLWTLPAGANGTSTSNSITIDFSTIAMSGDLIVKGSNSCATGDSSLLTITVNPLPDAAGLITSINSDSVSINENDVLYTVQPINNATTYIWSYSGTGVTFMPSSTTTTDSVRINFANNATSGNLTVKGHNACGDGLSSVIYPIYVSPVGINEMDNSFIYRIYPNPTKGIISIEIDFLSEKSELQLYNLQGKIIYSEFIYNSNNRLIKEINLNAYPKGIYFVKIKNTKIVKVEKVVLQ